MYSAVPSVPVKVTGTEATELIQTAVLPVIVAFGISSSVIFYTIVSLKQPGVVILA